jgi:hypothetical protein
MADHFNEQQILEEILVDLYLCDAVQMVAGHVGNLSAATTLSGAAGGATQPLA